MATASLCSFRQSSMSARPDPRVFYGDGLPSKKGGSKFRFRYRKYWQTTPPNPVHHHRPEFDTTMEPDNPRVVSSARASGPLPGKRNQARPAAGGRSGSLIHPVPCLPFCFLLSSSRTVFGSGSCFHSGPLRRANKTRQGQHVRPLLVSVEILLCCCWSLLLGTVEKDKGGDIAPWKFVQGGFMEQGKKKREEGSEEPRGEEDCGGDWVVDEGRL